MPINLVSNGTRFQIRRPLITANGFTEEPDSIIKTQLTELESLFGLRIFTAINEDQKSNGAEAAKTRAATNGGTPGTNGSIHFVLVTELNKPLIPKRTTKDHFDNAGILNTLYNNMDKQTAVYLNISDCIDKTNALASLKYDFQTQTTLNWNSYNYNTKTVLGYGNITDYLIAYAYFVKGIAEVNGLINFIRSHKDGIAGIINYATVSAARQMIQEESLNVPEYDTGGGKSITYNNEQHPLILKIVSSDISITGASFKPAIQKVIDDYIFNGKQMHIIETAGIGKIPEDIKPLLVKYIKNSPVEITVHNAKFFIPLFISQITGITQQADTTETDQEQSDKDFDVEFLEDDARTVQISVSNVKCAAQLYYCMVLGEELDVFNVVNYFTHKFLIGGGIEILDQKLRENLQLYVFSNKFTEASTNRILDRTRPAERQMFYRQVFNSGNARITDEVIVNKEFGRLWKVLMYESAKYLERAQESPNPDNYVSRQNVMQGVEDLQYNLSTHCSGMTNVITPIIYNELNFIIRNILMHPEVTRQVVPVGGTWWRVVETLYAAMKGSRPKSTSVYNKAKLGQTILKAIAEYNPSTFENDANFSGFISNVDAFITTQSIIQESLPHDIRSEKDMDDKPAAMQPAYKKPTEDMHEKETGNGKAKDEWDF